MMNLVVLNDARGSAGSAEISASRRILGDALVSFRNRNSKTAEILASRKTRVAGMAEISASRTFEMFGIGGRVREARKSQLFELPQKLANAKPVAAGSGITPPLKGGCTTPAPDASESGASA